MSTLLHRASVLQCLLPTCGKLAGSLPAVTRSSHKPCASCVGTACQGGRRSLWYAHSNVTAGGGLTSLHIAAFAVATCCCLQLGLDYSDLRDYLAAGDLRKADDETRALLIKMAGQGAVQRGWVYFTG